MPFINSTNAKADSIVYASTAHTNSTTEICFDKQVTIPANSLAVGDVIRVRAQGVATATTSTDAVTPVLRMGTGGVITDQAIMTGPAPDGTNGDIIYFDADIVIRTIGSSGTMVACGVCANGAVGTVNALPKFLASTAIDTTSAQIISVSADWSAQSSSDSCRLDILNVQVIKQTP